MKLLVAEVRLGGFKCRKAMLEWLTIYVAEINEISK